MVCGVGVFAFFLEVFLLHMREQLHIEADGSDGDSPANTPTVTAASYSAVRTLTASEQPRAIIVVC